MEKLYRKPHAPVRVDCHVHLFPDKLFKAIRKWFENIGWHLPYPYETERVLEILREFGVEEVWALTYAHKPGVAEGVNSWLGQVQKNTPMVRGFFSLHPEDDNPLEIARRALDEHGLQGLKLHCEVQKIAVDDNRLDPVFDLLEKRSVPCLLHSGDAPYPYTRYYLDVARVEERLHRNPELKTVIAHLGAYQTRQYLELTERYANLYLEVSFTNYPDMPDKEKIDHGALRSFKDRLLFGSDFPNLTFSYADQADSWWAFDWIREDAEMFFGGRARKLLPAES